MTGTSSPLRQRGSTAVRRTHHYRPLGRTTATPSDGEDPYVALRPVGHVRRFPRHATLVGQEASVDRLMVLMAGRVKEHYLDPDGREVILSLRGPGEVIGETIASPLRVAVASVTALEPVEALVVHGAEARRVLDDDPRLRAAVERSLADRLDDTRRSLVELSTCDAATRIARRLVTLADRWGRRDGNVVEIDLAVTQEEIGAWAGLSREATVKALGELRRDGVVLTSRRHITICDLARLRM